MSKKEQKKSRGANDPLARLLEIALETLGGVTGVIDPEMCRQAADRGERIGRLGIEAMESYHHWLNAGAREVPDPEASERLRNALLELWPALFSEFFGKYLNLPPLGPAREWQQKILEAVDAFGRLITSVAEFLHDFNDPFFQSLTRLPAIFEDGDRRIESADDLFQEMRAVFDTQYQAYLGSSKGVRQVTTLVDRYLEFKKCVDEAVAPALKICGLPTKQEMDEIYSRLHRLKKSQRKQQARLHRQEAAIEALQQQVLTLQAAANTGRKPAKKSQAVPAAKKKPPGRKKVL